jgi:hypothetical protein
MAGITLSTAAAIAIDADNDGGFTVTYIKGAKTFRAGRDSGTTAVKEMP